MTPIIFNDISRLSDEGRSVQERNGIAQKVYDEHGVSGLVTLWRCQDYYNPIEPLSAGLTPATEWWLSEGNAYAGMVREALESLSEEDALALLKLAMFPPLAEDDMYFPTKEEHLTLLYTPERPDKFSHASATTVRRIAQSFFPQYPQFNEPQCSIYFDTYNADEYDAYNEDLYPSHFNPLQAFEDDAAALQYLMRVHPGLTVQRKDATAEMELLLVSTDAVWAIYGDMGIEADEAYHAFKSFVVSTSVLPLPAGFHI